MNISSFSSVKMRALDNYQSEGREILLKLLPNNYNYHIYGVSVREFADVASEVKLDARFGVNVYNEEELQNFFEDFSGNSGTSWNKKARMDRNQKRIKISGISVGCKS